MINQMVLRGKFRRHRRKAMRVRAYRNFFPAGALAVQRPATFGLRRLMEPFRHQRCELVL